MLAIYKHWLEFETTLTWLLHPICVLLGQGDGLYQLAQHQDEQDAFR